MATTNFNQELWSSLLLKGATEKIAYSEAARYIGKVSGKTVHFAGISDVNIGDYVKETAITNQNLTDTGLDLDLNVQKYFSVAVESIDLAQSDANILGEITRKGSDGLRNALEVNIAGLHGSAGITADLGTTGTPIEVNSANVLSYLRLIARKMDEANASDDRWIIVPPWMKEDILTALPQLDTNNSKMLANGTIGYFAGLRIGYSNNVVNTAGSAYKILAGTGDSIRFGMNIDELESLRNPEQFGDIVRGLAVFGSCVSQAETLVCFTANEAAEA